MLKGFLHLTRVEQRHNNTAEGLHHGKRCCVFLYVFLFVSLFFLFLCLFLFFPCVCFAGVSLFVFFFTSLYPDCLYRNKVR